MRWSIAISRLDAPETAPLASLFLDAPSWHAALVAARKSRGEPGLLTSTSVEVDDDGRHLLDPSTRLAYFVREARADEGLVAPEPPKTAAPEPTADRAALPPPEPRTTAATRLELPAVRADDAPSSEAREVTKPSIPSPLRSSDRAPAAVTIAEAPPPPVPAPAPSTRDLPPFRELFRRSEAPGGDGGIVYLEIAYAVLPGTTEDVAETLLRDRLALVVTELREDARGKFVNLAVFDHVFEGKPKRRPVATLTFKDWKGTEPLVRFPLLEATAGGRSSAPSLPGGLLQARGAVAHVLGAVPRSAPTTSLDGLDFGADAGRITPAPAATTKAAEPASAPPSVEPATLLRPTAAEAETKAREEAAAKAREDAAAKAREEAAAKAREEAAAKAREEADAKAREEADAKAREEAEAKAREEADAKAREEADAKAREEAAAKAREEAAAKAREEAAAKAREEAEAKAREEAAAKAREEADAKAREEADAKAREEAAAKAREEAAAKAREEADDGSFDVDIPVDLPEDAAPAEAVAAPPPASVKPAAEPVKQAAPASVKPAAEPVKPAAPASVKPAAEPVKQAAAKQGAPASGKAASAKKASIPPSSDRRGGDDAGPASRRRIRLSGEDLLAELFEAFSFLSHMPDCLEGAELLLQVADEKLPCEAMFVSLFDINRRDFIVVRHRGGGKNALLFRTPEAERLTRTAMRRKSAVVVADASRDDRVDGGRYANLGVTPKSLVAAPVAVGGRYLGLIELVNPIDGRPFTEEDGHAISYMAEQYAELVSMRGLIIHPDVVRDSAEARR